jgi:hypothetical protein
MNVEIGTEAPKFLFWEYLFQNFSILSLQCSILECTKIFIVILLFTVVLAFIKPS